MREVEGHAQDEPQGPESIFSCRQKRVLLFAEWLDGQILEQVGHAHYVFTIPKLLRPIFKYHPKDLGLLCTSAWQALREMLRQVVSDAAALPGVVISVQSYGDRLNLHPHVHALAGRGVWHADGKSELLSAKSKESTRPGFWRRTAENSRLRWPRTASGSARP